MSLGRTNSNWFDDSHCPKSPGDHSKLFRKVNDRAGFDERRELSLDCGVALKFAEIEHTKSAGESVGESLWLAKCPLTTDEHQITMTQQLFE